MVPQRRISRHARKAIGEDVRVAGEDRFDLRHEPEILFEEDGHVPGINARRPEDNRFLKRDGIENGSNVGICPGFDILTKHDDNFLKRDGIENGSNVRICHGFDILTKHSGASLGKRRRDSDCSSSMQDKIEYGCNVDGSCGEGIGINRPGDWFESGRMGEDRQFLHSDRVGAEHMDSNISPIVTPEYRWNPWDEVSRATDNGRRDKHSWQKDFRLAALTGHPENPAIRATDRSWPFVGSRMRSDPNEDNYGEANTSAVNHVNPLCKVERKSVDRESFVHHVDGRIMPSLLMKRTTDNSKLLMSEMPETPTECYVNHHDFVRRSNDSDRFLAGIARESEHDTNNGLRSVIPNVGSRLHLDRIRQADEGRFLKSDKVDTAYNSENFYVPPSCSYTDLFQSRAGRSLSCSSKSILEAERTLPLGKPILETDYSLGHGQHNVFSACPRSVGQSYCDAKVVPYDPEVPGCHYKSSSVVVDSGLHSLQDFPPNDNPVSNHYASPTEWSSQCCIEDEYFRQHLHASDSCRTKNCLLSAEYFGKMEPEAAGHKIYKDSQFSESKSDQIPFPRISDGRNLHPLIEFDKHAVGSQGRFDNNIPDYDPNRAFSIDDTLSFDKNKGRFHFCPSDEMWSGFKNIKRRQNGKAMGKGTRSERTSVFTRLTPASEGHAQESESYMSFDDCDMDANVDHVMNALCKSMGHRTTKRMRNLRSPKTKDRFHKEMERDGSPMMATKMQNYIAQIEENSNQIPEETRLVEFKRRSESKAKQKGTEIKSSAETVEEYGIKGSVQKQEEDSGVAQYKCRKLVRPTFDKKEESNEGSNARENTDCKRMKLVMPTFDKKDELNGGPNAKVIPESKRRKLVRPTFGQKEKLNQGSNARANTESRDELVRRCENGKSAQNGHPTDPLRCETSNPSAAS
ncbi:uncharacterized protein LOC127808062 isoform X2 [Diospyros lotus]|nr:uncharacterized protein LOC127808062 isoform X2 [Diospyros lotus]XP_052202361.1 uncharacterized protein LOC127808062 isoform X2 [Diospyros lotus]